MAKKLGRLNKKKFLIARRARLRGARLTRRPVSTGLRVLYLGTTKLCHAFWDQLICFKQMRTGPIGVTRFKFKGETWSFPDKELPNNTKMKLYKEFLKKPYKFKLVSHYSCSKSWIIDQSCNPGLLPEETRSVVVNNYSRRVFIGKYPFLRNSIQDFTNNIGLPEFFSTKVHINVDPGTHPYRWAWARRL